MMCYILEWKDKTLDIVIYFKNMGINTLVW